MAIRKKSAYILLMLLVYTFILLITACTNTAGTNTAGTGYNADVDVNYSADTSVKYTANAAADNIIDADTKYSADTAEIISMIVEKRELKDLWSGAFMHTTSLSIIERDGTGWKAVKWGDISYYVR